MDPKERSRDAVDNIEKILKGDPAPPPEHPYRWAGVLVLGILASLVIAALLFLLL